MQHSENEGAPIPAITGEINNTNAIKVFPQSLQQTRATSLAYAASLFSTVIGFPLDTIKTRMQTYARFNTYTECAKQTFRHEGIHGFFRGIAAPMLSSSASKSLNVMVYTLCKPSVHTLISSFAHPIFGKVDPYILNFPVCFAAGALAGSGVSLFACPFEFTKVYSQLGKLVHKSEVTNIPGTRMEALKFSTIQTFKQIVQQKGIAGLYSGYRFHFLRDSLSSGLYYSIYETMKWYMRNKVNSDLDSFLQVSILSAGGLSGVASMIIVFPLDTLKSLTQKEAVKSILKKEKGLDASLNENRRFSFDVRLYRGLKISIVRSFLSSMVFFGAFEFLMAHVK